MTEESAPYKTDNQSQQILRGNVLSSNYFKAVRGLMPASRRASARRSARMRCDIACSLCLGYESFTTDEELCDRAIELTDILIDKIGGKNEQA